MKNRYKLIVLLFSLGLIFLSGCVSLISSRRPTVEINKKYQPAQLKEDFDFLFKTFKQVHPDLFEYTDESVVDSVFALTRNKLNHSMTAFEFYKLVVPFVSQYFDGHTFLSFPYQFRQKYLDDGGKIIPFDVQIDGQRLFVRENYSSDSTLSPNSEILSINDISSKRILNELRKYKSGRFESFVNQYIQKMFKPLLWAHYGFGDHFKVVYLSSKDNQYYTKVFLGITLAQYYSLTQRDRKDDYKFQKWTFKILYPDSIAVIDLNSFGKEDDLDNFKRFLDSTFTLIKQKGLRNLIIDVRDNGGGESKAGEALIDYLAVEPWVMFSKADFRISRQIKTDMIPWFLRWIPIKTFLRMFSFMYTSMGIKKIEFDSVRTDLLHAYMKPKELKENPLRYSGDIYVLIDNGSFSMSVMFAAFMKDYGLATLIGEETGQSANPYGGNYFFNLPNTHLRASVPSGRSYRPSGCNTGRGVIPDIQVKEKQKDLKNGIDTVMEFTKALIRERHKNSKAVR